MQCEKWGKMIIDRLADELGEDDVVHLEQHLAECTACRRTVGDLSAILEVARSEDLQPDPALESRMVDAMRAPNPIETIVTPRSWLVALRRLQALIAQPLPGYAVLSIMLIALSGGFWLGQTRTPEMAASQALDARGLLQEQPLPLAVSLPRDIACDLGFVPVYSDAIQQPAPMFADSL